MSFNFSNPATSASGSSSSLFGSTTSNNTNKPLFGGTSTTPTSSAGGLFGSTTPAQTPATSNLFGNASGSTTVQNTSAGTLFGAATASKSTPNSSFGTVTASTPTTTSSSTANLFGGATTTPTAPASNLFGGGGGGGAASTTPASAPSTNLFGGATPATTAESGPPKLTLTSADSGTTKQLFGSSNSTNQATASTAPMQTSSLFGQAATSSTSSTPASNLFGQASGLGQPKPVTTTPATQATQATPASTLFGQASNPTPATQANSTSSLFGAAQPSINNNTNLSTNSAFGNSANTATNAFGNSNNSNTKLSTSQPAPLFSSLGSATPAPTSLAPIQTQQQQQVVPGVKIDISNIKPTTRFFELHENLQKQIETVDNFIQSQIAYFAQIEAFSPGHGHQLVTLPNDVEFLQNKYNTLTLALDRDVSEIASVKEAVQVDIEDARRAFSAVETLKLPVQFQYSTGYVDGLSQGSNNAFASTDLTHYFEDCISKLDSRIKGYGSQLGEIESHLRTVDSSATEQAHKLLRRQAGEDPNRERVQELGSAMRIFEDAVLRVASNVGQAREGVIEVTMANSRR